MSDIDTGVVDSLKALDPNRPIREADIDFDAENVRFVPIATDAPFSLHSDIFLIGGGFHFPVMASDFGP